MPQSHGPADQSATPLIEITQPLLHSLHTNIRWLYILKL